VPQKISCNSQQFFAGLFASKTSPIVSPMKVIQPNCRIQFSGEDIDFIVAVMGVRSGTAETLVKLLTDSDARDLILDDPALFHALLEQRGCLRVSHHFYFYVLVRNVLRRAGIEDRNVADYVAEVLTEFSRTENTRCVIPGKPHPLDYFFEMLAGGVADRG
jgi:hypothetical protein